MTTNADIKKYAERYENLLNEKEANAEDTKELMTEAKENGIDTKALKAAIKKKRSKPNVSHEDAVRAYLVALGVKV